MISLTALKPSILYSEESNRVDFAGISIELVALMLKAKASGEQTVSLKSLLHRCKHLTMNNEELLRLFHVLVKSHLWSPATLFQTLLKFYILYKPSEANLVFHEALSCEDILKSEFLSSFFMENLRKAKQGNSNSGRIVHFFVNNPFVLAPCYRSLDTLKDLLAAGAPINNTPFMGTAFMRWCLDNGHHDVFLDLLKKGAPVTCLFTPKPIPSLITFVQPNPELQNTITASDCLRKLLEINPNIDLNESLTGSLLEKAMFGKDVAFAETIISRGGNPHARNAAGLNSLLTVCTLFYSDHLIQTELIELLLEKGVDLLSKSSVDDNALHLLCSNEYTSVSVLEFFLKKGFPVDEPNKLNLTPFDYAVRNENIKVMLKLMEYGSKGFDKYSDNDLIALVEENKSVELLKKMLERGFDINTRDKDGKTLVFRGANYGDLEWVKCLISHGGDINLPSRRGTTPLMMSIDLHIEVSKFLIEKGAKLFPINEVGQCAVDYLLQRDIPQLISYIATLYLDLELLQSHSPFILTETGLSEFALTVEDAIGTPKCPQDLFPFLCFSVLFNYSKLSTKILRSVPSTELVNMIKRLYKIFPELLDNLPYLMKHVMHFHKGHLIPKMTDLTIPPAPEGVQIETIITLFREINFTDSTQKNYINPVKVINEYQTNLTIEDLDKNLVTLCKNIREKTPYTGTPKPNTPELIVFYDRLELFLKHVCDAIGKKENTTERGYHLIDVALAADLCGARWIGDMYEKYKELCHPDHFDTFQDQVLNELVKLRTGIIRFLSGDDVHDYNRAIRLLGIPLGIPGAMGMADLTDPLRPNSEGQPFRILYIDFMKIYHPHVIYETVEFFLSLLQKKNIDLFYAWMSENVPEEWRKDYFDEITQAIQKAEPSLSRYNDILKQYDIPTIREIKEIDKHLHTYRIETFMKEGGFYDFNTDRLTCTTVLTVLKKLFIMSECRWGIIDMIINLAKQEINNRKLIPS